MNDRLIDLDAAQHFLDLLGKNGDACFRAIPHSSTPKKIKATLGVRKLRSLQELQQAQNDGLGGYLVINRGGDTKESITSCIAYYAEFDSSPEAEQLRLVKASELPEPSLIVRTGGKSLHFYWLLSEPVTDRDQWQADMKRLIAHLGSDKSVNDPSRVMRLPGCWYMDGNQKPVARVELIHETDNRYTREQLINALPTVEQPVLKPQPTTPAPQSDRTAQRALEQLQRIPPRTPGSNTRDAYLRLLWGLAHILGPAEAGAVMERHSPAWAADEDLIAKAAEADGRIADGTFFEIAKEEFNVTAPLRLSPQTKAATLTSKTKELPSLLKQLSPVQNPTNAKGEAISHNAGTWANLIGNRLEADLRFNDLTRLMEFNGHPLPVDEVSIFYVRAQQHGHKVAEKACNDALLSHSYANRFDPIADYLHAVEADNTIEPADLSTLSQTYLGTTDPLYDAMLRVAVLGAVHRRLNPGCQFDVVVVLKGEQGIRKSTFWKVLASPSWYCSSVPDSDLNLLLNVHQTWLFELAELENVTTRREVGQMKNLVTTSSDHIRVPYGKATEEKQRASIFVSSVNGDTFLRDETGHRRYLIIKCPQSFEAGELIDVDAVIRDRDRIWKAAVQAYRNDELPMLSQEHQRESNLRNKGFEQESPFEDAIDRWLSMPSTPSYFTSDQALIDSGCRPEGQIKRADQMEVTNLLTNRGWSKPKNQETINGIRGRFWKKLTNLSGKPPGWSEFGGEIGHPQTQVPDSTLSLASQPAQPKERKEEKRGIEGDTEGFTEGMEKGWSGREVESVPPTAPPDHGFGPQLDAYLDDVEPLPF